MLSKKVDLSVVNHFGKKQKLSKCVCQLWVFMYKMMSKKVSLITKSNNNLRN